MSDTVAGISPQKTHQSTSTGSFQKCLCEVTRPADDGRLPWDYSVLCSACCKQSLRPHIERHEQALLDRDLARERCSQRLARLQANHNNSNFSQLQFESQRLRERKAQLQKMCDSMAVQVAEYSLQNEQRRESLNPLAELQRRHLQRLDQSVCEGSMKQAIANAQAQVRILRFQWALKAFAMHRLDVRPEDTLYGEESSQEEKKRQTGRPKQARGIGKIGGLPLPHAGVELYGVLPPEQLQSALRLVASISSTVARCLGILLPHPVLLQRTSSYQQSDIIHSALQLSSEKPSSGGGIPAKKKSDDDDDITSTASLMAILDTNLEDLDGDGIRNNHHKPTGLEERASSTVVPPSMDPALVAQRLRHATAAVLAESGISSSSQYALSADIMHQDEFAIALQFLQNNVIALCIRAGVPVAKLWPAEAVLLNLYALQVFCEDQVKKYLK